MTASALSVEQSRQLQQVLAGVAGRTEADTVFLSDDAGNVIASASDGDTGLLQTVSALAVASFAATRELATMTGDKVFCSVFHEGQETGIYIHSITHGFVLTAIFNKAKTTLGLVRLYVAKAVQDLQAILRKVESQSSGEAGGREHPIELDADAQIFETGKTQP